MSFPLLAVILIAVLLIFVHFKTRNDNLVKIIAGVWFIFSWVVLVMWFTALVETWQIALNTPGANDTSLPVWERTVLSVLHEAVYIFPISRLALGTLYTLPFMTIPMALIAIKRSQTKRILIFSTLVNLLLFGIQVIIDNGIPPTFMKISIQGIILLVSYLLAFGGFIGLIFQRSQNEFYLQP
jgi:hypothetical protein